MELERLHQAAAAQEEANRGDLRAAMEREHAEQVDQLQVSSVCCDVQSARCSLPAGVHGQVSTDQQLQVGMACLPGRQGGVTWRSARVPAHSHMTFVMQRCVCRPQYRGACLQKTIEAALIH